jgi:signal transduction histidine kinase
MSYVVVIVAGAVTMFAVGTVVTRSVYESRLGGFGLGRGQTRQDRVSEADLQTALDESLVPALLTGAAAALVAAVFVAWIVGHRVLRPLDEVRAATQRMAAGDYSVQVPVPTEVELASLADDVNELGDHLATTERSRSQLLGEVTHELRTPITVILGQMEGLLDGVVEPTDEVYATVADEASRLQRLVDDLATLSRADEGVLQVELVELDLASVAAAAAERLRPQFDHEGVDLVVEPSTATTLTVHGDRDRLTQIVTNLLGNALAHTPSGGVVALRAGRQGETNWVEVVDTGSGIDPDELERIFTRFYRGPGSGAASTRRRATGRGLGLTIARGLARAHGGDVVASSDGPGTGSTFRLAIPAA